MFEGKKAAINGLIFAVGLMLGILGYVGDVYSSSLATILMLGVWLIGGALVAVILGGKK